MEINDKILSQIYTTPDAVPLQQDENKENNEEVQNGSLENRVICQIGNAEKKYDLASKDFRVNLYQYLTDKGTLQGETLTEIRQQLNLTPDGKSEVILNKSVNSRNVINLTFASPSNVTEKVTKALCGVVKFPPDVMAAICKAMMEQRNNPEVRKFLSGGVNDIFSICALVLACCKESAGEKPNFDMLKVMSYLSGFTRGVADKPGAILVKENDQLNREAELIRWEVKGKEDQLTLEQPQRNGQMNSALKDSQKKIDEALKKAFPDLDKKPDSAGKKYVQARRNEFAMRMEKTRADYKGLLREGDVADLEAKLTKILDEFKKLLKPDNQKDDLSDLARLAKQLDLLNEKLNKIDLSKVGNVPQNKRKDGFALDHACHKKFEADFKQAMTMASGAMWKYLSYLKPDQMTLDRIDNIWKKYSADYLAFQQEPIVAKQSPDKDKLPNDLQKELKKPEDYLKKGGQIQKGIRFLQQQKSNTCYMMSFVNGLLRLEKGDEVVSSCLGGENDALFTFKDKDGNRLTISKNDIENAKKAENDNPRTKNLSDFEWAAHVAHLKIIGGKLDLENHLSEMLDQSTFAQVFGYMEVQAFQMPENDMLSRVEAWMEMKRYHEAHPEAVLTVKTGAEKSGHFMTVTGFYKDGKNDFGVEVIDSLGQRSSLSLVNTGVCSLHAFQTCENADLRQHIENQIIAFEQQNRECSVPVEDQRKLALQVLQESNWQPENKEAELKNVLKNDDYGNVSFDFEKLINANLKKVNPNEKFNVEMAKKEFDKSGPMKDLLEAYKLKLEAWEPRR